MRATVLAMSCLLAASTAQGFDWPVPPRSESSLDPIEALRWDRISAWHAPAIPELRAALLRLDAAPDEGRAEALRAVVLRLMRREEEARAALRRALLRSPDGAVLDDPDVALTAAWLAARAGDFAQATRYGMHGLTRLPRVPVHGRAAREALAVEVARWAMAQGPSGLDDALRVLHTGVAEAAASALARATLVLALARAGRTDDARAVAIPTAPTLERGEEAAALLPGATLPTEVSAAVGVTLLLGGRIQRVRPLLEEAAAGAPEPWRAFQRALLAQARRRGL
jgi:hypothetical protein